jgi:hypothetical protein
VVNEVVYAVATAVESGWRQRVGWQEQSHELDLGWLGVKQGGWDANGRMPVVGEEIACPPLVGARQ